MRLRDFLTDQNPTLHCESRVRKTKPVERMGEGMPATVRQSRAGLGSLQSSGEEPAGQLRGHRFDSCRGRSHVLQGS